MDFPLSLLYRRLFSLHDVFTLWCLPVTVQCSFYWGWGVGRDAGSPVPPDRIRSSSHLLAVLAGAFLSLSAGCFLLGALKSLLPADMPLTFHIDLNHLLFQRPADEELAYGSQCSSCVELNCCSFVFCCCKSILNLVWSQLLTAPGLSMGVGGHFLFRLLSLVLILLKRFLWALGVWSRAPSLTREVGFHAVLCSHWHRGRSSSFVFSVFSSGR